MKSLGVRLALWYSAGIAIVLLLLGGFLYTALQRYLEGQALTLLRTQALPLQRMVNEEKNLIDLRQLVVQITSRPAATGVGVSVIGPNRQVLGQSPAAANMPDGILQQQLLALERGNGEARATVTAGQRYLLLFRPLKLANRYAGALVLTMSLQPVDATLHSFVVILAIGIGATLLVAGVVVVVVTRLGFRPLRDMVQKSHAIAEGDFNQRMDEATSLQEVRELAVALNYMSARLQAAFQAQRQFAADASHELRTPLTAMAGYIDVLNMGAKDDRETLSRVLMSMRSEVDRMTRLVRDLVSLARMDAGDQLQLQRVDLTGVVADVYEQARAMAPDRRINLHGQDGAWVEVDVDRMRQVLLNLADNAIKYTPPDARIDFEVQSHDHTVEVSVADSGPGIPPQDLPRLFDRFYRADQSRAREKGGAGLGLAIAKKIVEAHRGSIAASSPSGGGAVFSIRLPLAG